MKYLLRLLALRNDRKGQDLIEYSLMAGFIAVACAAAMPKISQNLTFIWQSVKTILTHANNTGS